MKNRFSHISILIFLFTTATFSQIDPKIYEAVNKVEMDSVVNTLKELIGDKPVTLFASPIYISSRHSQALGNSYAATYIQKKFIKLGLETYTQDFQSNGQNIYAIQHGKGKPNQRVIICAHYDNMPIGNFAPGADDNGSGTAAVLEAARILSKYDSKYTIIYALWDQEEQGLYGSRYYAQQAAQNKDSIIAVINLDMIGFDSNNDYKAEIHTRNYSNSVTLAQTMSTINKFYNIGLSLSISNPGSTSSDHSSFWSQNFTAIMLIESFQDFHTKYHTTGDDFSMINLPFYEKCTKLAVGSLAKVAELVGDSSVQNNIPFSFYLYQNYPNPFNPNTLIKYTLEKNTSIRLVVFDALTREIVVLEDRYQTAGTHSVTFDASRLNISSGVYFYALYAGDNVSFKKMIFAK